MRVTSRNHGRHPQKRLKLQVTSRNHGRHPHLKLLNGNPRHRMGRHHLLGPLFRFRASAIPGANNSRHSPSIDPRHSRLDRESSGPPRILVLMEKGGSITNCLMATCAPSVLILVLMEKGGSIVLNGKNYSLSSRLNPCFNGKRRIWEKNSGAAPIYIVS